MNKIRFLYPCILLCLCTLISCRKEFEDHYKTSGESTISENIVDILRTNPDYSLFVQAIDRLGLAETIGKSAIYTCLVQKNEDVESYVKSKGYSSIEEIPEDELNVWLNYHLIMGMYYKYDLEKKVTTQTEPDIPGFYRSNTSLTTREDSRHAGKQIRIYTPVWLTERADDYKYLKNESVDPGSFLIETIPVSDVYDIDASNGVIHVLAAPLEPLPRADEAIGRDTSLSIVNSWINRYVAYSIKGMDEHGKIDTTKIKSYTFGADIADESAKFTFVAPTNKAIRDLFGPYLEENFYNNYDSIPASLVSNILKTAFANNYWGMSDITRGNNPPNYFLSISSVYVRLANEIEPYYSGGVPSSNVMIYKVDKMATPPVLNSVEGGIYFNQSKYKEWGKMISKGYVTGLTDVLLYEHPDRTILIQPDDVWPQFVEDYESTELDSLALHLYASIINANIQNGEFKNNTYYSTSCGSIFYNEGTFTDYSGKTVNLKSSKSTWTGSNGAIYEIDGFLNPLESSDTTQNLYKMQLEGNDDYSIFRTYCDLTGYNEKLKNAGYFQYTVLAPNDAAMIAAGLDNFDMTEEEMKDFVQRHIVQRKIFTDGAFSGKINNLNGELLTISGTWDSFVITDPSGESVPIILDKSNRQANNGVLHCIIQVLKK